MASDRLGENRPLGQLLFGQALCLHQFGYNQNSLALSLLSSQYQQFPRPGNLSVRKYTRLLEGDNNAMGNGIIPDWLGDNLSDSAKKRQYKSSN
jgi:hypothetical protein